MAINLASRAVLYASVFLSCVSFSIVMPTIWPYLHSLSANKSFLAWVVSFYSVGEAVGAVLLGSLTSRHTTRATMIYATALGIFGSALYAFASAFTRRHIGAWMVFLGRFIQGLWTGGAQAIQQAHLAKSLPVDELTANTVTLNAYACFGFVIGPAFGLVFAYIPTACTLQGALCINQLTAPGYFVLIAGIFITLSFVFCFDRDEVMPVAAGGSAVMRESGFDVLREDAQVGGSKLAAEQTPLLTKLRLGERAMDRNLRIAIFLCNLVFFIHFYGFALQETITTPLVQTYYSWSLFSANLLFTGAGLCSLLTFGAVGVLSHRVSDSTFTSISLALGAGGYALLLGRLSAPPEASRFLFAFCLVSVAFPLGRAGILSLYTKTLPPNMQGTWQGVILAVGAVARIIGPFFGVSIFAADAGGLAVFGGTAVLFAATLAAFGVFRRAFVSADAVSMQKRKYAALGSDEENGIVP